MENKLIKFRLVLDVDYVPNGESKETLKGLLFNIPDFLTNRGLITDYTMAEVDRVSWKVTQRK